MISFRRAAVPAPQGSMRNAWHTALAKAAMLAGSFALAGCVTSKKYKMAKAEGAPPPQVLNWSAATASADLALHSVIVFKGPGSWKREARWDEYVVSVRNAGADSLIIEKAAVIDFLGVAREWGPDPWELEKASYTNWEKYGKTGVQLVAGAGAVVLYGAAVASTVTFGMGLGTAAGAGAGTAAAATVLVWIPIVAVVDISAVAIINHKNKNKVNAEFARRALPVPQTIASGQTVTGSYFFPMTPGPQRLVLRGRRESGPVELTLDLQPLSQLHLKPADGKSPATPP
jgi:hypothetical protein